LQHICYIPYSILQNWLYFSQGSAHIPSDYKAAKRAVYIIEVNSALTSTYQPLEDSIYRH